MMITPFDFYDLHHATLQGTLRVPTTPFFFVSDNYTALHMKKTIRNSCWHISLDISDSIPFNSTGNIQWENAVQFYRGDSAAIFVPGYDNTKELPNDPKLVPNPPFPQDIRLDALTCSNSTIGESIPLMDGGLELDGFLAIVGFILLFSALFAPMLSKLRRLPTPEIASGKLD